MRFCRDHNFSSTAADVPTKQGIILHRVQVMIIPKQFSGIFWTVLGISIPEIPEVDDHYWLFLAISGFWSGIYPEIDDL